MIDVAAVLKSIPHFKKFCSVAELKAMAEALRGDPAFQVEVVGTSQRGTPIHHVRFGKGLVKALFVGYPHANEPMGGLTVASLMALLRQKHQPLTEADVEWHVVPCIDPDGAVLNEGWSQKDFTLANYMRHFHRQEPLDQVECSFPITHKRLSFNQPTTEAKVLKGLIERVRPDFYYSLHNAWSGGAFYCLNRDIGAKHYRELYELLRRHDVPLQTNPMYSEWSAEFSEGITEIFSMKKFYDFLEKSTPHPEGLLRSGGCSWEYLTEVKSDAVAFLAELPYVKHPSDGSKKELAKNLRQAKLRADADAKFVATVIVEEWERVKDDLDSTSAFYKKIHGGLICMKEQLHEGLPSSPFKTRDILLNPVYGRSMTEGESFDIYLTHRFWSLCHSYEFVRLLKVSTQTTAVRRAIERLELLFDEYLQEIAQGVDLNKLATIDYDTLARVQLGSGLIVLNSVLEQKAAQRLGS